MRGFCWIKSQRIYSLNNIQEMLDFLNCHLNDAEYREFKKCLDKYVDSKDVSDIMNCVRDGDCKSFSNYDSSICNEFVYYFENLFIINEKYNCYVPKSNFVLVGCRKYSNRLVKYAVVDLNDNTIEYRTKEDLISIVKRGISIDGVDCLNGSNIFDWTHR